MRVGRPEDWDKNERTSQRAVPAPSTESPLTRYLKMWRILAIICAVGLAYCLLAPVHVQAIGPGGPGAQDIYVTRTLDCGSVLNPKSEGEFINTSDLCDKGRSSNRNLALVAGLGFLVTALLAGFAQIEAAKKE